MSFNGDVRFEVVEGCVEWNGVTSWCSMSRKVVLHAKVTCVVLWYDINSTRYELVHNCILVYYASLPCFGGVCQAV